MQKNNIIQKNRVYAPIIVGVTLLLIVFLVYPAYAQFVDHKNTIHSLEASKSEKQSTISEIEALQAKFATWDSTALTKKIEKYARPFVSSDIMEAITINTHTQWSSLRPATINIGGVSLSKWGKLPSGMSLGTANISIAAVSLDDIINYLNYLTVRSKMAFIIENISLPLDTAPSLLNNTGNNAGINVSITLWIYYYD